MEKNGRQNDRMSCFMMLLFLVSGKGDKAYMSNIPFCLNCARWTGGYTHDCDELEDDCFIPQGMIGTSGEEKVMKLKGCQDGQQEGQ